MNTIFSTLVLLPCSVITGLLGFWVGRCARKLPIVDGSLPWTFHRGQIPPPEDSAGPGTGPARWPQGRLHRPTHPPTLQSATEYGVPQHRLMFIRGSNQPNACRQAHTERRFRCD